MAFGFGAPAVEEESNSSGPLPAIDPTSWENLCYESGGSTAFFALILIVLYLVGRYHILIAGSEFSLKVVTSPLYQHDDDKKEKNIRPFHKQLMGWMEKVFVSPFVPAHLDSFVMWIFLWFFLITVPMAVTRYYENRWMHDTLTIQGPLNVIAYIFGCKALQMTAAEYTEVVEGVPPRFPPPPKSDKWGRIDYFFSYHLAIGLIWLAVGFLQIYRARDGGWCIDKKMNWKAHRIFGRVALVCVSVHILMVTAMIIENPVNQHPIILFGYCGIILRSLENLYKGIKYASKHSMKKHKWHMFSLYARTIMGSGTIRIAAWALWFIGHFLPPKMRVLIDRGDCQTYAKQGIGDATDCWRPVFINMLFTDLIVIWLEVLFLTMPNNMEGLEKERKMKRASLEQQASIIVPSLVLTLLDPWIEKWLDSSSLPYIVVVTLKNVAEFSAFIWYFFDKFGAMIREWLNDHRHAHGSHLSSTVLQLKKAFFLHEHDDEHAKEE